MKKALKVVPLALSCSYVIVWYFTSALIVFIMSAMSLSAIANAAGSAKPISIVGSSTVYPFSTVVAERFGRQTAFKTPKVESTGTGGGMKLFCAGVSPATPSIANASRRIKASEIKGCHKNGVNNIIEVFVGYDGIVLANAKTANKMVLSLKDIFLALAKHVPNPDGSKTLVDNPYKTWRDVNRKLPAHKIEVLGPPPTSGTRDAFVELALEGGCKQFSWIKAMKKKDKARYKSICHAIREDGAYVEAGENDNLIVQKLVANPKALGVFGFSFLDQNSDKVQSSVIDNATAEFDSIASGQYPVSRPLYFYVKEAHIYTIPGLMEFVRMFTSEQAYGDEGYLIDRGLIPLDKSKRQQIGLL